MHCFFIGVLGPRIISLFPAETKFVSCLHQHMIQLHMMPKLQQCVQRYHFDRKLALIFASSSDNSTCRWTVLQDEKINVYLIRTVKMERTKKITACASFSSIWGCYVRGKKLWSKKRKFWYWLEAKQSQLYMLMHILLILIKKQHLSFKKKQLIYSNVIA